MSTVTDSDLYTLAYEYDALDRLTRINYPDGTYEHTVYSRLDAERQRDRMGRWSHVFHDALRRIAAVRDPLGRTVTNQWCNCGSLEKVLDAAGNATSWERDSQGRVIREELANGSSTTFLYETTTSRLKQTTDAKSQTTAYEYFTDGNLKEVSYSNTQIATPAVRFTYDSYYDRVLTMEDGSGTTTYTYGPISSPPSLGAGMIASVDGPLANDTSAASYDELDRPISRSIGGVGSSQTYDALGRATTETNALGVFSYSYVGATDRLATVTYPNSQTTTFSYFGALQDKRLQEIAHRTAASSVISRFTYDYDRGDNVTAWTQEAGGSPRRYELGYDPADQLLTATLKTTDLVPVTLKRYGYGHDLSGNRTGEQIDDMVTMSTFNKANELLALQPGGDLLFRGSMNEPGTVAVQTNAANVTAEGDFEGRAAVAGGNSTVDVKARDPNGNERVYQYQIALTGANRSFLYDATGNLTLDGLRTYEWDGANRLVAVAVGTQRTEFAYDGLSRRARMVEKSNGVVTSDTRFVWCGTTLCEERSGPGSTVARRFFGGGMQDGTDHLFFTKDHLGSLREATDISGAVRARYDYDPYGRRTKTAGDRDVTIGFTGHYHHAGTDLLLAPYRAYDAAVGRWISQDPIGLRGGLNTHAYVANPVRYSDPLGLIKAPGNPNHDLNNCDMLFIKHYFVGGGADFWLPSFMSDMYWSNPNVRMALARLKAQLAAQALQKARSMAASLCQDCDWGTKEGTFQLSKVQTITNVEQPNECLYSLGTSALFGGGQCTVAADCANRTFGFACAIMFSINDWYKNPANRPEGGEFLFGQKFQIRSQRGDEVSGRGEF